MDDHESQIMTASMDDHETQIMTASMHDHETQIMTASMDEHETQIMTASMDVIINGVNSCHNYIILYFSILKLGLIHKM